MSRQFGADDRAVSITVTHVLTLGITAILISGLMLGAGSLLESETERSADGSLETIGERLSSEISNVDRMADDGDTITLRASHPQRVASSTYTITPHDGCSDAPLIDDDKPCLELVADDEDVTVYIPVSGDVEFDGDTVRGGTVEIDSDGDTVTITNS